MSNISERLIDYYNNLIRINVIDNPNYPVTLEWLKRQRIVEGRQYLNVAFSNEIVDQVLGKESYLSKVDDMLFYVRTDNDFSFLPKIASYLAYECKDDILKKTPVGIKYSSLDSKIPITIYKPVGENEQCVPFVFKPTTMELSLDALKKCILFPRPKNPCYIYYAEYVRKSAYYSLQIAFDEIRAEAEKITR